jgi:hypothetical protein
MQKTFKEKVGEFLLKMGHDLTEHKFMAEATLEDGVTQIMTPSDEWAAGVEVFIMADGAEMPLPIGEYALTDGSMIVVEVDGIVANYVPAEAESEETPMEKSEDVEQAEETSKPKAIVESVVKETKFEEETKEEKVVELSVDEKIEAAVTRLEKMVSDFDKEVKEKFSEVTGIVKAVSDEVVELSKPVDKVKVSPEGVKKETKKVVELSKQEVANLSTAERIKYFQNKLNLKK